MTREAVRQQLVQLQREGWVESRQDRGPARPRAGRPAISYSLTAAGDHLFPKHYDDLAMALIDGIAEKLGPEALKQVLAAVADARVQQSAPRLRGLPLAERVAALRGVYLAEDPFMTLEPAEGGFRLIEHNCPFLNVALNRPALCSVTVNALTRLLGVRVVREERFQNGDGRCVFRIFADEVVSRRGFFFEPPGPQPGG